MISDHELGASDFDAQALFSRLLSNDEPRNQNLSHLVEYLEYKLEQNNAFFARALNACKTNNIHSAIKDVNLLAELQVQKLNIALENFKSLAFDLEEKAGYLVKLSSERQHLTLTITKTKQLHMMNISLEKCKQLKVDKQFAEIAKNILAVEELLGYFSENDGAYREVSELKRKLVILRHDLCGSVFEVFNGSIDESGNLIGNQTAIMAGCCLLADVLDGDCRSLIIKSFLEKQFLAYRKLFPASLQVNEIKSLSNRFAWCKRVLIAYEKIFYHIFPDSWQIEILLSQAVGNWIKEDLVSIFTAIPDDRRVSDDIFMQAFVAANSFDRFITLKFRNKFTSTVAQAFQDYHFFLFEAKEDEFNKLKDKLLPKDCVKSMAKILKKDQLLFANFDQIFLFFSNTLESFAGLSNNILMVQMSFFLSDCIDALNLYLQSQIQLVKKKIAKKWTDALGKLTCAIINTIDYCISNIKDQTEKLLSHVLVEDMRQHICLDSVKQRLLVSQSQAFYCLLGHFESDLEILFGRLKKTTWAADYQPVDPSLFLNQLLQYFGNDTRFRLVQVGFHLKPITGRDFFERYLQLFFDKLRETVLQFRYIAEPVAEQLLIDLFGLRSYFSQCLPPSSWSSHDLTKWTNYVTTSSLAYESLLKILLTPASHVQLFIQSYLLLSTDYSSQNFLKVLAVKGIIKTSEQEAFLDELAKHIPPTPAGDSLLKRDLSLKASTWSMGESLFTKIKDLGISKLRKYSRNIKEFPDQPPQISPLESQSPNCNVTERGI